MILEHALLSVRPADVDRFRQAMTEALPLIAATPGFLGLTVTPCLERPGLHLLLVRWRSVADHVEGFRGSDRYPRWQALLHHFYDPFPEVLHFGPPVVEAGSVGSLEPDRP